MRAVILASILAMALAGTALAQNTETGTNTGTTGDTGGTTGTGGGGTTTGANDAAADGGLGAGSIIIGLLVIAGIVALVWYAATRRRGDHVAGHRRRV